MKTINKLVITAGLLFSGMSYGAATLYDQACELTINESAMDNDKVYSILTDKGYTLVSSREDSESNQTIKLIYNMFDNTTTCEMGVSSTAMRTPRYALESINVFRNCDDENKLIKAVKNLPTCEQTNNKELLITQPNIKRTPVKYISVGKNQFKWPTSWWKSRYKLFDKIDGQEYYSGTPIHWVGSRISGGWCYVSEGDTCTSAAIFRKY